MKKINKLKYSLLLFAFLMMIPSIANAYIIQYETEDTTYSPSIRNYYATVGSEQYMAYCLDPGLAWGHGKSPANFTQIRPINPSIRTVGQSDYIYDLAFMYAYQKMKENGWTKTTNDFHSSSASENRVIGTTAFRLIQMALIDNGNGRGVKSGLTGAYSAYRNKSLGGNETYINAGIDLAEEAINFARSNANTPYSEVVNQLKVSTWNVVDVSMTPVIGTSNYQLKIEIEPSSQNIRNTRYDRFKVGFLNSTVQVISQTTVQGNNNHAISTVVFDGSSWDKQDLGTYVDTYYCDIYSATSNLFILKSGSSSQQDMLIVIDSDCTHDTSNIDGGGGGRVPIPPNDICSCDKSTGMYTYQFFENGKPLDDKTQTWHEGDPIPSGVDITKCPKDCKKEKKCEKEDNKFYCNDGKECPEEDYKKQCTHNCEKPNENEEKKYYCKESSHNAGDGPECTESEYEEQCECPELEKKCEENDEEACEEYDKKCLNCNPVVTIPSDCDDLQDYGIDIYDKNYFDGGISDISKKATACNKNKPNSIKSCVLGKQDASQESYENKTTFNDVKTSGEGGNKYCKVWCEEEYNFDLPTAQRTVSGGYFTLLTKVSGTRTCYTSSANDSEQPIDKELFESDLEAKHKEVIDAWNEYSKWKAAASVSSTESETSCTHEAHTYDCNCSTSPGPNGTEVESCDSCDCAGCSATGKVVTKTWSYRVYSYDGVAHTETDSYSDGSAASCGHGGCSGSIGENPDRTHAANRDSALANLNQKIQEFNDIIAEYNSCSGNMNGTTGWENDMKFNPEITFSYNEGYLDKDDENGKFVKTGTSDEDSSATYCDGDTDRSYNCNANSEKVNGSNNVPESMKTTINKVMCDESGCRNSTYTVSKATWVKKEKKVTQEYKSGANFSTYTQYGTIRKTKDVNGKSEYYLYTQLPDGAFPISLIQKTGVFPFTINFNNIGQSNVDGTLGRLIGKNYKTTGGKSDILTSYNALSPAEKCDLVGNKSNNTATATTDAGYVCHYINNCDDCKFKCEDDDCSFDDENNDCEECKFTCDSCIFDGNSTTYSYRTVSLNKLFPNESRTLGYNWRNDIKGEITRREIEGVESPESIYETPQYSFTLTPTSLSKIRKYNDEAGSYTNATIPSQYVARVGGSDSAVYCENESFNGINYSVRCRSRFLDLIEASGKEFATDVYRITSSKEQDKNAWELFTERPECLNGACLKNGIGPSWRLRSVD